MAEQGVFPSIADTAEQAAEAFHSWALETAKAMEAAEANRAAIEAAQVVDSRVLGVAGIAIAYSHDGDNGAARSAVSWAVVEKSWLGLSEQFRAFC